jgi:small subunit ribosomal protein S5
MKKLKTQDEENEKDAAAPINENEESVSEILINEELPGESALVVEETKEQIAERERLASWTPKTQLGRLVKNGEIKDIDFILDNKMKILEEQIVDHLLNLKTELVNIGQAKGKFGGGKRRAWKQTQRKTAEGNVPTFSTMAIVGDENGHVGIGYGKAKETLPARAKALRQAKLNIIKVRRGSGSFESISIEQHSIPFKVEGKCGSVLVVLYPAPPGTGLVIGEECKKILRLAGIKDIYSKTFGQTRTNLNLAKACINALKKTKS